MKNKIILLFILTSSITCFAQKQITWKDLSKVTFTEKYFPAYDQNFLKPKFSDSVKALEGQLISIKGYFLNIDPKGKLYILSKGPMSACFFCGIGGPETAIELEFTNKPSFRTDNIVQITGTLKLNPDDVDHFNYILKESKGQLVD